MIDYLANSGVVCMPITVRVFHLIPPGNAIQFLSRDINVYYKTYGSVRSRKDYTLNQSINGSIFF